MKTGSQFCNLPTPIISHWVANGLKSNFYSYTIIIGIIPEKSSTVDILRLIAEVYKLHEAAEERGLSAFLFLQDLLDLEDFSVYFLEFSDLLPYFGNGVHQILKDLIENRLKPVFAVLVSG